MKNKTLKNSLIVLIILLVIITVFVAGFFIRENKIKSDIDSFVNNNIVELNTFVKNKNLSKINSNLKDLKVSNNSNYEESLEFLYQEDNNSFLNSKYGIYYIPDKTLAKEFGKNILNSNENWIYSEEGDKKSMYIKKIKDNFFYFKSTKKIKF